jgi:hypothetical protein
VTTAPPGIPAIKTWYRDRQYRSRTEAKWGVFLHELGIPFDFETEGFVPEGIPYLPDFIVLAATGPIWVEIKPTWQARGIDKFRTFAPHRPKGTRAAMFVGPPQVGEGNIWVIGGDIDSDDPLKGPWEDDTQEWRPCPDGVHFDVAYAGTFGAKFAEDGCADSFGGNGEERIRQAVRAASAAQFGKGDE